MKSIKRASISQPTLQGILRITTEGPPLIKYEGRIRRHEDHTKRKGALKRLFLYQKSAPHPALRLSLIVIVIVIQMMMTPVAVIPKKLINKKKLLSEEASDLDSLFEDEDELE